MVNVPERKIGIWSVVQEQDYLVLKEGRHRWMCTQPTEVDTHREAARQCFGNVLIGGLGLGIIVKLLQENPKVTNIDVVEISQEVIELVWPYLDTPNDCINDEIRNYMRTTKVKYDCIYLDTWRDEHVQYELSVLPLRILAEKITLNVFCWKEDFIKAKSNG